MSSVVAKTEAAGGSALDQKVLAFTSSLSLDRQLLREDLLGSLAHVSMLAATGLVPRDVAASIARGLKDLWKDAAAGALQLPDEEDVHMAVEAELLTRIGAPSRALHTARSRNDQVATDLRLHVREQCADTVAALCTLASELVARAQADREVLMPSYTHRQRAQPVSAAYWWSSWAAGFLRDAQAFAFAMHQADVSALGVGAISGTSLPNDRELTRKALGFQAATVNGLDTVGDRDFALDYLYAAAKLSVRIGRLCADLIDFSSQEFGFVQLGSEIACGSSMMPHKRNPDVFELLRGKSGHAIGALTGLLATVKGLPGGYSRDLQEDRAPLLETSARLKSALPVLSLALGHVKWVPEKCAAGLLEGPTQATDLAEALVKQGVPFREAYQKVGSLVRLAREQGVVLSKVTVEQAQAIDARFDAKTLACLEPAAAVARKESAGATGPHALEKQWEQLKSHAAALSQEAAAIPRIAALWKALEDTFR
ncbi:MAG: argininosuccinate lyase [Myxococcaceae bacterium]